MAEKTFADKIMDMVNKPVVSEGTILLSRIKIKLMSNNTFMFSVDDVDYSWCYSKIVLEDGTILSTKDAKRLNYTISAIEEGYKATISYKKDGYLLVQNFFVEDDKPYFTMSLSVENSKKIITTNQIVPLEFAYPSNLCHPLFSNLDTKMLLVPYDNDMWVHYESCYLAPGRTSYEVTSIYDDSSFNGIIIGALDFDFWKNGVVCANNDARVFSAVSGISDSGTHDQLPHGFKTAHKVQSSRFVVGYYNDIRAGLKEYGKLSANKDMLRNNGEVIFGWNSYSALAISTTIDHLKEAGRFIQKELPNFKTENNTTYINLDATFGLDKGKIKKAIKQLHEQGQKVGTYIAPLMHMEMMNLVPLKGSLLKFKKDIVLKKPDGTNYLPIDSKLPVDITIPEAEKDLRIQLKEIVDLGFDYLKIDFLSHGALEGQRYNRDIKTGRQALAYFYNILLEELKGSNIFISLSIAPLYPAGYGHARRMSCDSFGHGQDSKYVLNALTYSYWCNDTIYQYNDPDHTVLYNSIVDGRGTTTVNEARSRYNASVISGSLMLLSDDFGTNEKEGADAKQRVKDIANNEKLNEIARKHKAFMPLTMASTSNIYYLNEEETTYLAVFNFDNKVKNFTIFASDINAKAEGKAYNVNTDKTYSYRNKMTIQLDSYDSVILELQ